MNRRKFLKAVAGIPLVGLLVKLPSVEDVSDLVVPIDVDGEIFEADYRAYRQFYSDAVAGPGTPHRLEMAAEVAENMTPYPGGVCLFVDPASGKDDNSGLGPATPLATLQKAFEISARDNDWIVMLD